MKRKKNLYGWLVLIVLLIGAVVVLFPIFVMISMSFKQQNEIYSKTFTLFPSAPTLGNYIVGWQEGGFNKYFLNSVFVTSVRVVFTVVINAMAGFAFAKYEFRGKGFLFMIVLAAMMIPDQLRMIPLYSMMHSLGWINSFASIIFPGLGATFGTFLMRQYSQTLPDEIIEAARIDGCGDLRIFARIAMPLCMPALITNVIFQFMWGWNDFLYPLLFLRDESKYTVQLALSIFRNSDTVTAGPIMAMSLLSAVPIPVVFFSLQKYFVAGIAMHGVKG